MVERNIDDEADGIYGSDVDAAKVRYVCEADVVERKSEEDASGR